MGLKLNNSTVRQLKDLLNKVPDEHLDRTISLIDVNDVESGICLVDVELSVLEEDCYFDKDSQEIFIESDFEDDNDLVKDGLAFTKGVLEVFVEVKD